MMASAVPTQSVGARPGGTYRGGTPYTTGGAESDDSAGPLHDAFVRPPDESRGRYLPAASASSVEATCGATPGKRARLCSR